MRLSQHSDKMGQLRARRRSPRIKGRLGAPLLCVGVLVVGVMSGTTANASPLPAAIAASVTTSTPSAGTDLTKLVNPFIGTENAGLDFPAAGAPFGMVQEPLDEDR